MAQIVRQCGDLPGQELFQYMDEDGDLVSLESTDVNDRLREITGEDFTTKDIRTWGASVIALSELLARGDAETKKDRERNAREACDAAAAALGNSRAICRKSYVYPAILDAYVSQKLFEDDVLSALEHESDQMASQESALMALLARK